MAAFTETSRTTSQASVIRPTQLPMRTKYTRRRVTL
jgi:hypothetical protein